MCPIIRDGQTLETFLRSQPTEEAARHALLALARNRTLITRPFSRVRDEIDGLRSAEGPYGLNKFEAHRFAGWTLVTDITERAQLFYDGRQGYVFGRETNGVLPVDRDNLDLQLLLNRYGVAPKDSFFNHALHAVRLEAQDRGKETTVFSLAHYDVATNRVWDHVGDEVTTAQLFASLRAMAGSSNPPRSFDFKSAVAFGQYLQSNRATLKALFGAEDRTAGGRKRLWKFSPPKPIETESVEPAGITEEDLRAFEDWAKKSMD